MDADVSGGLLCTSCNHCGSFLSYGADSGAVYPAAVADPFWRTESGVIGDGVGDCDCQNLKFWKNVLELPVFQGKNTCNQKYYMLYCLSCSKRQVNRGVTVSHVLK